MSNLIRAWTNDRKLPDDTSVRFLKYLQEHKSGLISIGDFVFDKASLLTLVNLKMCDKCLHYQEHDCCGGNSRTMPKEQVERVREILPQVVESMNSPRIQDAFNRFGGLTTKGATSTRGHPESYCMFSYQEGDCARCAIHKWCLREGKEPWEYKPYSCSLFPLEGVIMPSGVTVVFCGNSDTADFSMWSYRLRNRVCVNFENLHRALARDIRENKYLRSLNIDNLIQDKVSEGYRPVYLEQESVLRYFLGNSTYEKLVEEMEQG